MINKLINLRRELHMNPELSGSEEQTSERITNFLKENTKAEIINKIGGHGLIAVFEFSNSGPTIMIRCDMDALPIQETNTFSHRSKYNNVSHKCGHDGHMAIVSGLGIRLSSLNLTKGKVMLLYQPAEETGKGAEKVFKDPKFENLRPDYMFALHNLPTYKKKEIIIKNGQFTPSAISFSIKLKGKKSHAGQPERGNNPSLALAEIIMNINKLNIPDKSKEDFALLTPVYINMGEKDYGISPGFGEIHYTARTFSDEKMESILKEVKTIYSQISKKFMLETIFDSFEYFPAVINNEENVKYIEQAAFENKLNITYEKMQFGEDFGWFTKDYKSALFGLGAGTESPALHNDDYDFPDDIIETGINMFETVIKQILK